MSQEEQFEKMRLEILGNSADRSKDDIFKSKLDDAEIVALNTLYPYDLTKTSLNVDKNKRLANWQVRCAISLFRKMESIGVQNYSENGVSVTYLTSLIPSDLLGELIPKAGVPK